MTAYVIDASALVDWLLRTPRGARVAAVVADADALLAPELVYVETASAVHCLVRAGTIEDRRADVAVRDLRGAPLRTVSHRALVGTAWAMRGRVRIADAYYLACAQTIGWPLLTSDARLARAPTQGVTVTLVR